MPLSFTSRVKVAKLPTRQFVFVMASPPIFLSLMIEVIPCWRKGFAGKGLPY